MKKRGLHIAEICVGVYFIASVFYAYYGDYNYLYELTALSNLLNGVILIVCGILGLCQKAFEYYRKSNGVGMYNVCICHRVYGRF